MKSRIFYALAYSLLFGLFFVDYRIGNINVASYAPIGMCILAAIGWTRIWLDARRSGQHLNVGDVVALSLLIILAKEKDRRWFRRWLEGKEV